jgi:Sulfotransferase domain
MAEAMACESNSTSDDWPTVLHVTHAKAGSQWIHKVLHYCAPNRIVAPQYDVVQFLQVPVRSGAVYPKLYVTRKDFDQVVLPSNSRRFVVIRDLRDTLVSWYFSVKISRLANHPVIPAYRAALNARSLEDGLIWSTETDAFGLCADIQRSWHDSGEKLIRYEDLLERDEDVLTRVLLEECGMPIERARLQAAIHACRFERLTGRARGEEDISSHERKGIAGDWRNYFTDRVKDVFKERFGPLLLATGYESGPDW